jgi:hypothetical protein
MTSKEEKNHVSNPRRSLRKKGYWDRSKFGFRLGKKILILGLTFDISNHVSNPRRLLRRNLPQFL